MKKLIFFILGAAIILSFGKRIKIHRDGAKNKLDPISPARGTHGMVSSAHPLATEAGIHILKRGGNAFDAAVAVASTLNVVEPMMSGMGGYGTILIYDAKKNRIRFLDSSGKIPKLLNSDVFRKPNPNWKKNRRGAKAVSTPGNVNAWEALFTTYGQLKWPQLFSSAIRIAEQGFTLDQQTARLIGNAFRSFPSHAKQFYGNDGKPLKPGDRLIQKDLAKSLKMIAQKGAMALYGGEIGKLIDAEMRKMEGFLSLQDLIEDNAEWWEPIHINYRKYQVYTASPPSTAFPSLIRLGLMSQYDLSQLGHNSVNTLHRFIEATKHAFWCRLKYAGDPEVNPPPLTKLLSPAYWSEITGNFDLKRAKPFSYPGLPSEPQDQHTTHFVVADQWGNIVCATQTLGNSFGSRIMPPGTGIWLNNSLAYCTFEPKGNPMDAHAGRRKLSGDCPTIVMKDGKPWVALGTPGGHTIGQTVPQMVMNMIDFKMNIQGAISAPRISFIEPQTIAVEEEIDEKIVSQLKSMGHRIRLLSKVLGNAHGLSITYDTKGKPIYFNGGSDLRGHGLAKGLTK
jgi:gamma-glutamyltranspeptidase/glutathione hydrolase